MRSPGADTLPRVCAWCLSPFEPKARRSGESAIAAEVFMSNADSGLTSALTAYKLRSMRYCTNNLVPIAVGPFGM